MPKVGQTWRSVLEGSVALGLDKGTLAQLFAKARRAARPDALPRSIKSPSVPIQVRGLLLDFADTREKAGYSK